MVKSRDRTNSGGMKGWGLDHLVFAGRLHGLIR